MRTTATLLLSLSLFAIVACNATESSDNAILSQPKKSQAISKHEIIAPSHQGLVAMVGNKAMRIFPLEYESMTNAEKLEICKSLLFEDYTSSGEQLTWHSGASLTPFIQEVLYSEPVSADVGYNIYLMYNHHNPDMGEEFFFAIILNFTYSFFTASYSSSNIWITSIKATCDYYDKVSLQESVTGSYYSPYIMFQPVLNAYRISSDHKLTHDTIDYTLLVSADDFPNYIIVDAAF